MAPPFGPSAGAQYNLTEREGLWYAVNSDDELLRRVLRSADKFAFIGLSSDVSASVAQFRRRFGAYGTKPLGSSGVRRTHASRRSAQGPWAADCRSCVVL